jgi:hypothetical protein
MKAVIYHADGPIAKNFPQGLYETLFRGFRENAAQHGLSTVHLTLEGHPGWGDENYFLPGDPADIVYNREVAFVDFLKKAPDDVYWFTEPDSRIHTMFPPLTGDLSLLRRQDSLPISPWWRLARPSALPFFEETLECFDTNQKTWHGDSVAFLEMWKRMGSPGEESLTYRGLSIELRNYKKYSKSQYSRHVKGDKKIGLFESTKEQ